MAINVKDRHLILREIFRHYLDFYDYYKRTGHHTITHKGLTISFLDLKRTLEIVNLADRKMQAFVLNVLEDKKQKEVADIMGITTVSVGQYVKAACEQLSEQYWTDYEKNPDKMIDNKYAQTMWEERQKKKLKKIEEEEEKIFVPVNTPKLSLD